MPFYPPRRCHARDNVPLFSYIGQTQPQNLGRILFFCCPAVAELEASKSPDARVRRLFVDPLGRHALLTLQVGPPA